MTLARPRSHRTGLRPGTTHCLRSMKQAAAVIAITEFADDFGKPSFAAGWRFHFRRGKCAFPFALRVALAPASARPCPRRPMCDAGASPRSRGAGGEGRLPIALLGTRAPSRGHLVASERSRRAGGTYQPRPHPRAQERACRHEKRNADQRLAAGGMPDRDR